MMGKRIFAAMLALILAGPVFAETPEEKGLRIAQLSDKAGDDFSDVKTKMKMILINKKGSETSRQMHSSTMKDENGEDKMLMVFDSPRDQKGTAMLTHSHDDKDNDQWLYLPALKKVKKIASKSKSGPFLGSEFSFEDIGGGSINDYTYKWIRDEEMNGRKVWVLESYPKDKYSGYTKTIAWIDQEEDDHRPYKVEFYDRKKSLLKSLSFTGYKKHLDKYWNPAEMHMVNHQTGKSTKMQMFDFEYDTGLEAKQFTKNSLKRAR